MRANVMADVVPLPEKNPCPRIGEAELRARAAAGLRAVRQMSGMSVEEFAEAWSRTLGRTITPELVESWEDPLGPKPPCHWSLGAYLLVGCEEAGDIGSRVLLLD